MAKSNKLSTSDLAYIAMFTAIITICSWIYIPTSIPFTLQVFGIFLSVGVLGGKRGTMAVLTYVLLGIVGVPVFPGFTGGVGILLGNTGGYIVGFVFSALAMWYMEHLFGNKKWNLLLSMIVGILVCYAFGTVWFMFFYTRSNEGIGLWIALTWCVIPYIIPDIVKIAMALTLSKKIVKIHKLEEK